MGYRILDSVVVQLHSSAIYYGDSSGLRVILARLLSTRVRFSGSPPNVSQWCNGNMPVSKTVVEGSSPSWDANFNKKVLI